jgi:N6-adenosine-specific RNA methylase IME4
MKGKNLAVNGGGGLTLPGILTATAWELPDTLTFDQWKECGKALDKIESGAAWWRGDWWNSHGYGEHAEALVDSEISYGRAANCGLVCKRFEFSRRRENLTFYHHELVAGVPPRDQDKWLDRAEREEWSANQLKAAIQRQAALDRTKQIDFDAAQLGKFAVLYADPPWQYEYPPIGATNRSIENHYPTMVVEEICALPVNDVAYENSTMFLWATSPKLPECMKVLEAWGFACRTTAVWVKDKIGMGYYFREQHELLLVAKRGELPPPPPEVRPSSIISAPRLEHSAKPPVVYDLIDSLYPGIRKLELFGRGCAERPLWKAWGNQVEGVA